MKTLQLIIATLAVSLAMIGCAQQDNPVTTQSAVGPQQMGSTVVPGNGGPTLTDDPPRIFDRLDLIAKPPVVELKTVEADAKLIEPNKKTDLRAKLAYKSYGKKDVKFDAKLTIDKGSVDVPTLVTLNYDEQSGALVVGPAGVQFLKPALLDVQIDNLDPFADNSTVFFVAVLADG